MFYLFAAVGLAVFCFTGLGNDFNQLSDIFPEWIINW
jgi:hypothetical protein